VVALGRPGEGVIEVLRIEHHPDAVAALVNRIAGMEADPAEVRVVIETRHGLLVEVLVDAGYTVLPVNPELVSRRRGPARKDDAEDARICCLLALDRHAGLKRLIRHGQIAGELRPIARDDERACRDERRLLNRLRADLDLLLFGFRLPRRPGRSLGCVRSSVKLIAAGSCGPVGLIRPWKVMAKALRAGFHLVTRGARLPAGGVQGSGDRVEAFGDGKLGREVPACTHCPAVPGVPRFDRGGDR
jgi:hypothetical protein